MCVSLQGRAWAADGLPGAEKEVRGEVSVRPVLRQMHQTGGSSGENSSLLPETQNKLLGFVCLVSTASLSFLGPGHETSTPQKGSFWMMKSPMFQALGFSERVRWLRCFSTHLPDTP